MKRLSRRDRVLSSHSLGQTLPSSLGAARPLPPSAAIGPGGQSVGQAAQFCLGRRTLGHSMRGRVVELWLLPTDRTASPAR